MSNNAIQQSQGEYSGGMSLTRALDALEGINSSITKHVNAAGVFCLAAMMGVITVDVFSRFVFNSPFAGSLEMVECILVLTVLFSIPYTAQRKQHVSIDFLTSSLSEKRRSVLESVMLLIGVIFSVLIVWRSILHAMAKARASEITAVLEIPLSPFVVVVAFGFALTAWVFSVQLIRNMDNTVKSWKQAVLWLIVGAAIAVAFYLMVHQLRNLPWKINVFTVGMIGLGLLFAAFVSSLPIFLSLLLVGFLGMCYLRGAPSGLSILGLVPFDTVSKYDFSVVPLFVLMGEFCFFSGISKDLYEMAYKWIGPFRGGLAMGTICACGGFAAVCGDSLSTALTMGTVAIPEMKRYKYDMKLATGCVAAGGTLGVMIPPSLAFIFYSILTDQSIATLFMAGVLPGILLVLLFMATIYVRTLRNPLLGPAAPKTTWKEKMVALRGVWATIVLFVGVMGGMYVGVFTPTEGGGIGAFGAFFIGIARRRLSWKGFLSALLESGRITGTCLSILIGANVFGYFTAASKVPQVLSDFVTTMQVPSLVVLIGILVIYLFLGCLMPAIPMLLLTVPIFYPAVLAMGYNPIWFGVIVTLMFEMAVITPPMGINVLAMPTVVKDVSLADMFKGIVPFLIAMIIGVIILIAFPQISLILPNLLGAK